MTSTKTPEELAEEYCATPHEKDAFHAGYEAAQEQLADADKVIPQWISVKDRLPEINNRMSEEKGFKIIGNDISDGYHTFGELYQHRYALFIALCLMRRDDVVWKKDHYEGWDCVYLKTNLGQISYHVPAHDYRHVLEHNFLRDESFEYDGHTAADVVKRLGLLIGGLHSVLPISERKDQLADADKVIIPQENCEAALKAMEAEQQLTDQAITWIKTLPPASERCNQCACQGYRAGHQAAAPQWISMKDRLPELNDQVLVYGRASLQSVRTVEPAMLKKRPTYGAIAIADEFWWQGYDIIGYDGEVDDIVEVTHWMPLPEPPKEEG